MNKLDMAHEMALAIQGTKLIHDMELVSDMAWEYADKMQAESDKRKVSDVPEVIKNSVTIYQVPQKDFTFNFDFVADQENWQPDWSQAQHKHNYWAMDEDGSAFWYEGYPSVDDVEFYSCYFKKAPSFDYQSDWRESLRKRP